jgi:isocitrate dehydrogenase kinase/phosphatase
LKRAETASSAAAALTDSRLAALCAEAAQHAFANYQGRFDEITHRARERFLAHDLKGSYADSVERLHLYGNVLANLTTQITDLMGPRLRERNVWTAIKAVYSSLVAQSRAWEIGESFFNSLTRRIFATEGVDQAIEFVDSDFDAPPTSSPLDVRRIYSGAPLLELISAALTEPDAGGFAVECWNELGVSVRLAAERVEAEFRGAGQRDSKVRLEMINRAFYRGHGA